MTLEEAQQEKLMAFESELTDLLAMNQDRSLIKHVSEAYGFALVNGCQGIFLDDIHWTLEGAVESFDKQNRKECGPDEQIVWVKVSIVGIHPERAS